MRVNIEHKEVTKGFLSKKTFVEVHTSVEFSNEELAIIERNKLRKRIVLEREPHFDRPQSTRNDPNLAEVWHLHIYNLIKDKPEIYSVASPSDAKAYEERLTEALHQLKAFITANSTVSTGKSFEL